LLLARSGFLHGIRISQGKLFYGDRFLCYAMSSSSNTLLLRR
jgi:hypothetical protein